MSGVRVGVRNGPSKARQGSYHSVVRRGTVAPSDEPEPEVKHGHGQQRQEQLGGGLGNQPIAEEKEKRKEKTRTPEAGDCPNGSGTRIAQLCHNIVVKIPYKGKSASLSRTAVRFPLG